MVTIGACIAAVMGAVLCYSVLHAWESRAWRQERRDSDDLLGRMWQAWRRHRQGLQACRQEAEIALRHVEQALGALDAAEQRLQSVAHSGTEGGQKGCGDLAPVSTELEQARESVRSVQRVTKRILDATAPCEDPD